MHPSILVIGSTGNTGRHVIQRLSAMIQEKTLTDYRILGLTRSIDGSVAKSLANLPGIQMLEVDWTQVDAEWLQQHMVERAFFAGPVGPTAFNDESLLLTCMLEAGVKHIVRISSTAVNLSPTAKIPHARMHWAIENLLDQPEFRPLGWTSLQPNIFTSMALASAVAWVKNYRTTGRQTTFKTSFAEDTGVAMIDPEDVGNAAAHLLVSKDIALHDRARYQLSGPEDITGKQIVDLLKRTTGATVNAVRYKDLGFLDHLTEEGYTAGTVKAIKQSFTPLWDGACSLQRYPTSRELHGLADPAKKVSRAFEELLTT